MTNRTPWTQSSLLSNRVKPKATAPNAQKGKGKGRGQAAQEPPKSAAILALEATISKLQNESGDRKDEKGGCFCLARTHELSPYCPMCLHCGLILCTLNAPYNACPHCSARLFSATAKVALLQRLRADLGDLIAKEEEEAERAMGSARQAAGDFPSLNKASTSQTQQIQVAQTQTHKVLSLNSKTKRVTVASYTPAPPAPSKVLSRTDGAERTQPPERVPPPPEEITMTREPPDVARPWQDKRNDGFNRPLIYVRDPREDREQLKEERRTRKKNKKRATGGGDVDEDRVVSPSITARETSVTS